MNDKKKKKEFVIPEAEIVDFTNEDIITSSNEWGDAGGNNAEFWG